MLWRRIAKEKPCGKFNYKRGAPQKNGAALDLRKMSRGALERLAQAGAQLVAAMSERLSTPLVLLDDQVTSQTKFVEIAGALVKSTLTCQSPLIVYDPAHSELIYMPAIATLDVSPAREGDLLNAMEVVKECNAKVQLRKWWEKLRRADEAQAPLEIKIVNASEIGSSAQRVFTVKRDDSGKMTGVVEE